MNRRITFTVIGGFLGAGKTSLVNRVLADAGDVRFAVLVNDFGALNIDQDLIERRDSRIMQLSNGCICCSLAGGLVDAMVTLMTYRDRIDHILIEASGVSYPGRIMDFARIDPDLRPGLTLVLIDAASLPKHMDDPRLAEVIAAQMNDADLFMLTKTDIASRDDTARARTHLATTQPRTPVLVARADDSDVIAMLLADNGLSTTDTAPSTDHQPHGDFVSVALTAVGAVDERAFRDACATFSGALVRGKGFVRFASGTHVWQQSGRLTEFHEVGERDGVGERAGAGDRRGAESRIVLISADPLDDVVAGFATLGFQPLTPG